MQGKQSQTMTLKNTPSIRAFASVVGKKEGEGPFGKYFDAVEQDSYLGEKTWEKAEGLLQHKTVEKALGKGNLQPTDIDCIFGGDLLNQCIGSSFGIRDFGIPFYGLYGACSTMAESLSLASVFVDGGYATRAIAVTSSHFCSSERQFRFPLEYGNQRPPTAQWTVTGSGAVIVEAGGNAPHITHVTTGKIIDFGVTDANNMGAAMAPAFVDTVAAHFRDTGRTPMDYDKIFSGDLGFVGSALAKDLLLEQGFDITMQHMDCGCMMFDQNTQDTHAGGSGCGCSASILAGFILPSLLQKMYNRVLFVSTGALLSATSAMQGSSIPGIAHAVVIEA